MCRELKSELFQPDAKSESDENQDSKKSKTTCITSWDTFLAEGKLVWSYSGAARA